MILPLLLLTSQQAPIHVGAMWELRAALAKAAPGTTILIKPGDYRGGLYVENVRGTPNQPVVVAAEEPANPPRFLDGAIQLAAADCVEVRDLRIEGVGGNAIGIDDGGKREHPADHVVLKNLRISNVPGDGSNGIKLAGVDDFRIENCSVQGWAGGCAIDMVGCHRGNIQGCTFEDGRGIGVQAKGASSQITIQRCRFTRYGGRGVNIGGSTGIPFFRPPLESIPAGKRYEAKDITLEDCTFTNGAAPVAFVGVDGALVRRNRITRPERWALRILQETSTPDFLPSRNGRFEENVIVFRSAWNEGGVNIGPGTAPQTFRFRGNTWYCEDKPEKSQPTLPTPEVGGIVGKKPDG